MAVEDMNEEDIFRNAIKFEDRDEQANYVKRACGDDVELRTALEALLQYHHASSILDAPALESSLLHKTTPVTEKPGTTIGRYKLLEKIGEGGMAVVYMAEQQEPIRRKVALKIIKLGMDTKSVIVRFEAERQALAMMDHPNIAKVLDAGATDTGRPYFVMELVTGVSITEYCDKNELNMRERLALFIQVCNAVQHAHQKGIIHRDIKPSNVMVTRHEGTLVPKVIDFGIAKATNQRLTEKTMFTRYAHIIGTPAYMSPEQADLGDMDVDTRSDIYSLGVLLYELLTGTTPFSKEELRSAGYLEMQRVIREQEPPKPSTKLSSLGETLTDIAKCHSSTPDLLTKAIRGDLDWIVMKTLEKSRDRRYNNAAALAMDVQRHLNDQPILARAPKITYRMQKFLRRRRYQTITSLTIAVLIVTVLIIYSMWNQNRLQLAEAQSIVDGSILFQARESFAKTDYAEALKRAQSILDSKTFGSEAKLLYAGILVQNQRSQEAVNQLEDLLDERPEISGAAHSLLARILWESESSDSKKLEKVDEHRRKAEELLPETAEAYFLRAMTALTIKEKFELLDGALRLDPGHYESRRLRAFTYYASRKYESMKEDALVMVVLRAQDSLGYSLRAKALRELGHYEDAIADYDRAIELTSIEDPQHTKLYAERCDIYLRMGDYQRVIADAQECLKTSSDGTILQFRMFCALIALGNYEEASALYRRIAGSDLDSKRSFRDWSMKYVFDTLDAGQSWHPMDSKPDGTAFLAMLEAEETYYHLSAKAKRLTTDGFSADWSPDGTKLAFSLGVHGYSGVALYDMGTGQTELLIVPGKDPRWSPDGRHIAFVRDCQSIRLSELTAAERRAQERRFAEEEVWIMDANGTKPKRLTRGGWPSWSKDSRQIYYHSRSDPDQMLCSISIEEREAEPILACPSFFPSVSPDSKYVAYLEDRFLKIINLTSHSPVSDWAVPPKILGGRWMPNSRQFNLRGWNDPEFKTGLWIYDLDSKEAVKVLTGQIGTTCLSPDETKLVFSLGPPLYEIWVAGLDPNISTLEALGPGRTREEHYQEMVDHYTRIIEADPEDAENYLRRAQYYHYLHDEEKVHADMYEYRAILNQRKGTDRYSSLLETTSNQEAHTKFIFGTPVNLGPTVNSPARDWGSSISADGLELYFDSNRSGDYDIWVTARATTEDDWGPPVNLGSPVNGTYWDQRPCISANGLMLFFGSYRSCGWDIWVTTRTTRDDPWGTPVNLGSPVNSTSLDIAPSISSDGLSLFFGSERPGGFGSADLWLTKRETMYDDWSTPINLGPVVNSMVNEAAASISADGRSLFFSGAAYGPFMPDGYGNADLWVTTRATKDDDWSTPVNLGPNVNSSYYDLAPNISMDGSTLYFASDRDGGVGDYDLWKVSIASMSRSFQKDSDVDLSQK